MKDYERGTANSKEFRRVSITAEGIYFQLDEVLSFATFELQDDGIVAEISQVKDRVRKVIEKLIS